MAHFIVIFQKRKKKKKSHLWPTLFEKRKNDWGERMREKRMKRNEGGIIWKKWEEEEREEEGERRESN